MSGIPVTLGWIGEAAGGTLEAGDPQRAIGEVRVDSRALAPGDLFVAIRGPRFDGHVFVPEAAARGAAGAVVERGRPGGWGSGSAAAAELRAPQFGLIQVDDTVRALQDVAHALRLATDVRVVAITGSAGKTTTKEAIAALLATRFVVVRNIGNLNNHIGLPLSLMQVRGRPDVAVMELGMNHAGEIGRLVEIAAPDVRVWTNVGDAHLGFFASADAIADAKAEILQRSDARTVLVCNADDPRVMARVRGFVGRTLTFGTHENATVRAVEVEDLGLDGMRARVTTPSGAVVLHTPLLGRGNLANVLAAAAVALEFGIELDVIAATAGRLQPAPGRGTVTRAGSVTVVDDSYNSSPAALRTALDVVTHESRAARRVAVLGEMLELGGHAVALHEACGREVAAAGVGLLVTVGGAPARALGLAAVAAGMPAHAVMHFDTSEAAAPAVASALRDGDLVLVKGSRGTRTDLVADRISAERA